MKKIFFCLSIAFLLAACNNEKKADTTTSETKMDKPAVALALTPSYSSSFEMGNPEYSAMIVKGSWKDWVDNNMDDMKSWVADTVLAIHSDNSMIRGADNLIAKWKDDRAKYSSAVDTINAVMSVHSTDKNENWVLVWATAYGTKLDGTKDTSAIMETWRINKDGKADLLLQFDRAKRKQ